MVRMLKFSPGPWRVDGEAVYDSNGLCLVEANCVGENDLALMAASPEMYDLLRDALDFPDDDVTRDKIRALFTRIDGESE